MASSKARIITRSLEPESEVPSFRTMVGITEVQDGVELLIEAEDTAALRAASNSYLRWMEMLIRTIETKEG